MTWWSSTRSPGIEREGLPVAPCFGTGRVVWWTECIIRSSANLSNHSPSASSDVHPRPPAFRDSQRLVEPAPPLKFPACMRKHVKMCDKFLVEQHISTSCTRKSNTQIRGFFIKRAIYYAVGLNSVSIKWLESICPGSSSLRFALNSSTGYLSLSCSCACTVSPMVVGISIFAQCS